ncbi:MAG TPA: transglycosylase SLT domain-containing protein [Nitrosospira sp.]|nr:transglycosylase SLT domain-containing protein [Nitrosospira sp.]
MKKFVAGLSLVLYAGALHAATDDDFMSMRQAFQKGDRARVSFYAQRLQGHMLEPYAAYYQLRPQLEDSVLSPDSVKNFLLRYQDTPVADRLLLEWVKILGRNEQWDLFGETYAGVTSLDTELACYSYRHRVAAGDAIALAEARPLWFNPRDLPESCAPLFDTLVNAGVLTVEDIWARLRLALEAGNVGVAKRINEYLPDTEALDEGRLSNAQEGPLRYLENHRNEMARRADREIALFAMLRMSRISPDQAYVYWPRVREQFNEAERSYFLVQLADQAARRLNPRALEWFAEAGRSTQPAPLSDAQLGWKVRSALRAGNWALVLDTIQAMSEEEQGTAVWRYWKARALKADNKVIEANAIFAPLSVEHHFYGQLAEEELGLTLQAPIEPLKITREDVSRIERLPGIRRALALYRLNLRTEASREWGWAIRDFDDRRLLAAAEVARQNGIYDRAIHTADKTTQNHDFSLRFLAPHRDTLRAILKQQELDEAWVYGLIRQESRFVTDARSSAGAMGLMQLMPATAKWAAKRMGMRKHPKTLSEVNTNLKLGTYYLKHVLDLFDNHPLLASAAYNAGPSRALQWRDDKPLEGAIYAESIPFSETRDYVKKVMSNSTYYARTFGHQLPPLKQRLGIVPPRVSLEKFQ